MLLYLVLRRKDGTLRLLGKVTLGAAAALLAAVLLSAWQAGRLFRYIQTLPLELSVGYFNGVLHQLTVYLVLACAGISAYQLAREVSRTRAEARALRIRGELTRKNYQELAEKNREAAGLRHEWRGQLAALQLIAEEGDLTRLREKLGKLAGDLDRAVPRTYSGNLAIDAILQSAADQAERLGVAFRCHAVVPPELRIDEGDLCALLLNLLDNALEAAAASISPRAFCRSSARTPMTGSWPRGRTGRCAPQSPTRRSTASACGRCGWWRRSTTASWTFTTPGSDLPSRPP